MVRKISVPDRKNIRVTLLSLPRKESGDGAAKKTSLLHHSKFINGLIQAGIILITSLLFVYLQGNNQRALEEVKLKQELMQSLATNITKYTYALKGVWKINAILANGWPTDPKTVSYIQRLSEHCNEAWLRLEGTDDIACKMTSAVFGGKIAVEAQAFNKKYEEFVQLGNSNRYYAYNDKGVLSSNKEALALEKELFEDLNRLLNNMALDIKKGRREVS